MRFAIWGVMLILLLAGGYYLFFKRPDVIPSLAPPAAFQQANDLKGVKLDPGAVVQSAAFQQLRPQVGDMPTPATGRSNPFFPL